MGRRWRPAARRLHAPDVLERTSQQRPRCLVVEHELGVLVYQERGRRQAGQQVPGQDQLQRLLGAGRHQAHSPIINRRWHAPGAVAVAWRAMRRVWLIVLAALVAATVPGVARAQIPGTSPDPIPQDPRAGNLQPFLGFPASLDPVFGQSVPRHPFMAPNGLSNIHGDAYQTDTNRWAGPLGPGITAGSALFARECASVAIDSHGRLVDRVRRIGPPGARDAPAPHPTGAGGHGPAAASPSPNPLQDFSGGGYFYLDHLDRAVISAGNRHILVVAQAGPRATPVSCFSATTTSPRRSPRATR